MRQVVPRRGQLPVVLSNTLIVVSAAVLTAALALVVEDAIPKAGEGEPEIVPLRAALLLGMLVVLLVALAWRTVVHDTRGTLFYVQILNEGMANRHTEPLRAAQAEHMSLRTVTRWIDLASRRRGGVVDVVEPCHEVGRALEESVNTDRDDTGYTVAPNLLWPMSLAVGAHLPQGDNLRLLELGQGSGDIGFELNSPGTGKLKSELHPVPEPKGDRVGVWLALTESARFCDVNTFAQFGVSTVHVVTYGDKLPGHDGYQPRFDRDDLASLGADAAEKLREIKAQAGSRELVVIAMVPKTTALAIGWQLSQMKKCPFFHSTHLMAHDPNTKAYVPMRVRESQPTTPPTEPLTALPPSGKAAGNGHDTEAAGAGDGPTDS
ncbi:hypothetical protein ACWGPQ_07085 [Saccharomonospora azurea]|uniref:hypothetical protein n=1 Tax=Saccharomonospora sp. NB11 TaxID=1642298 RepID=UPI001E4F3CB9|nr:hypothetical protein [Saccharomonospora sp. NB11]